MKPGNTGLRRIIDATGYSCKGLASAFRNEAAFRQELLLVGVLIPCSFWLARDPLEWLVLVVPLMFLLVVELLNTAIENAVDRIGAERHPLAGQAKDQGSAAVLISLLLITLCWGVIAWSRFLAD